MLVREKNRQAVVHAIQERTADFIQQFDADQWDRPYVPAAPSFKSIEIAKSGQANVGDPTSDEKQIR